MSTPLLSLVIPVFNEAGNVTPLMDELNEVLTRLREYEVIWIDDGSTDNTPHELASIVQAYRSVRAFRFSTPSGQSSALWCGLRAALGETIVTLDGDGQNDPHDIPRLLDGLNCADMVIGFRRQRMDTIGKRLFTKVANAVRNLLTGSRIPDSGCALRAFRREMVNAFIPFDGMHRFLPTLAEIAGYRVSTVAVTHRPRRCGRSKYGNVDRLTGPFLDCLMLRRLKQRKLDEPPAEPIVERTVSSRLKGTVAVLGSPFDG